MNPILPYRWEARYARGRLLQYDVDGWHTSREIDGARLKSLVLLGHPHSPIELPAPRPTQSVDEVLVRTMTEATLAVGSDGPATAQRWTFVGYRYGTQAWVLQIDPAGHLVTQTVALAAGAPLNPVPCDRCPNGRH